MLPTLACALETTVVVSTAVSVLVGLWLHRTWSSPPPPASSPCGASWRRLVFHPLAQLLLVCGLLYVNQVLFSAFILRAHAGRVDFIDRFIPGPWFAIGRHDPFVLLVGSHVGEGLWLAPSLLRVQAFLELPFTMFAYLAVARLLGRRLHVALCRGPVLALVAISFSLTFSIIELTLPNPYTHDDLVLRAISALVTPVYVAWVARGERVPVDDADGPTGLLGLLTFLAGAGALAYVVLALYDAFLLYNLAHLPRYTPGLVLAISVAVLASFAATRVDQRVGQLAGSVPSLSMMASVSTLRVFTVLFFVPSLSLRYWALHPSAISGGLALIVMATLAGVLVAVKAAPSVGAAARRLVALPFALAAGGIAATASLVGASNAVPELALARFALSFLVVAIVVFRALEIAVCWRSDETKASADEA